MIRFSSVRFNIAFKHCEKHVYIHPILFSAVSPVLLLIRTVIRSLPNRGIITGLNSRKWYTTPPPPFFFTGFHLCLLNITFQIRENTTVVESHLKTVALNWLLYFHVPWQQNHLLSPKVQCRSKSHLGDPVQSHPCLQHPARSVGYRRICIQVWWIRHHLCPHFHGFPSWLLFCISLGEKVKIAAI